MPTETPNLPEQNPGEGQNAQPAPTEINPAKPGNDTEVDLDKTKINTYPNPPERQ